MNSLPSIWVLMVSNIEFHPPDFAERFCKDGIRPRLSDLSSFGQNCYPFQFNQLNKLYLIRIE